MVHPVHHQPGLTSCQPYICQPYISDRSLSVNPTFGPCCIAELLFRDAVVVPLVCGRTCADLSRIILFAAKIFIVLADRRLGADIELNVRGVGRCSGAVAVGPQLLLEVGREALEHCGTTARRWDAGVRWDGSAITVLATFFIEALHLNVGEIIGGSDRGFGDDARG